jgi:hypothetical protein
MNYLFSLLFFTWITDGPTLLPKPTVSNPTGSHIHGLVHFHWIQSVWNNIYIKKIMIETQIHSGSRINILTLIGRTRDRRVELIPSLLVYISWVNQFWTRNKSRSLIVAIMIFLLYLPIPIGIQSGGNERDLPYPFVWHHSVCIRLVTLLSIKSAYTRSMQLKQLHRRAVNRYAPFRFAQESATASVFSLSQPYDLSLPRFPRPLSAHVRRSSCHRATMSWWVGPHLLRWL